MEKRQIKLLAIVLALVAAVAAVIVFSSNVLVNGKLYAKKTAVLDLRGEAVSIKEYEALRKKLPNCDVYWDVPLSGGSQAEETTALTITSLTEEDVAAIGYLRQLKTVNAEGCTDYPQLLALKSQYPHLEVSYTVTIDGTAYPQDTVEIAPAALAEADIQNLQYLPALERVQASLCSDDHVNQLKESRPDLAVITDIRIGGRSYDKDTTAVEADGITHQEAELLKYLPNLKTTHLKSPKMEADQLLQLQEALAGVQLTWEVEVCGQTLESDTTEVEFIQTDIDLEQLKAALAALPELETVFVDQCGVDSQTMAAWREEVRSQYKVVWTVQCGDLTVRTDDTFFMPIKYDAWVSDKDLEELKYCEDMLCVDIGHNTRVTHCEWAAHMPKLKYLILADTSVTDITPLAGLKELVFLELFVTSIKDYSPLLTCTALEDLNLCYCHGDPEPVTQMTWLKRLWWTGDWKVNTRYSEIFQENIPGLDFNFEMGGSSTGEGWRKGEHYYAMRDLLGMRYLTG